MSIMLEDGVEIINMKPHKKMDLKKMQTIFDANILKLGKYAKMKCEEYEISNSALSRMTGLNIKPIGRFINGKSIAEPLTAYLVVRAINEFALNKNLNDELPLAKRRENYNNNIKKLGLYANTKRLDKDGTEVSFKGIAKQCNMSDTAVGEFLKGKSVPNLTTITTVIQTIEKMKQER